MISDCTEKTWWERCSAPSCKHYPKINTLKTQSIVERKNIIVKLSQIYLYPLFRQRSICDLMFIKTFVLSFYPKTRLRNFKIYFDSSCILKRMAVTLISTHIESIKIEIRIIGSINFDYRYYQVFQYTHSAKRFVRNTCKNENICYVLFTT